MTDGNAEHGGAAKAWQRWLWFAGLWAAGVATLATVAYILRLFL
ncbi:DUF2474 domain-containing protein [Stappia sp. F7233]|uniref:DUF2474 domain-containing protein n=1 Tax=Stappia albiluteola TaxID=2758565 RepID=A0A839AAZ7_9HYPH|nr:DUF2474 family protein [Stappia albiluteola]MBA5775899.1 DUF2474 domain-containing protein [Stappia albiluteola]